MPWLQGVTPVLAERNKVVGRAIRGIIGSGKAGPIEHGYVLGENRLGRVSWVDLVWLAFYV